MPDYLNKYNPPDYSIITCADFGRIDGMNGSCQYCLHNYPYEWEMCSDESWKRSIINWKKYTEEDAINFINERKQKQMK